MTDQELFINYIADNYDTLKRKYRRFCLEKQYEWSDDIYQDTILKCHQAIERKGGLNDTTPQGIEDYFFVSFKLNVKREKQYARNAKRDHNVTSDDIMPLYEAWYNGNNTTSRQKVVNDLFKDFSILYIMAQVEDAFDAQHFYCFKLKVICGYTYRQIQQKTSIRGVRQKVASVKNFLMANVKKDDIRKLFYDTYKELI